MAKNINFLNNNSIANITANFERVNTALRDVVSRSGELPNSMGADLDMNGGDILNANVIDAQDLLINGLPLVEGIQEYIDEAEAWADVSEQFSINSSNSATLSTLEADRATAQKGLAQEYAEEAYELVQQAVVGFAGFTDGLGYDFGSVSDSMTYFNQDWGTIV